MKVKSLKDLRYKRGLYPADTEFDMDKEDAEIEIERGNVEAVKGKKAAEEKKGDENPPA